MKIANIVLSHKIFKSMHLVAWVDGVEQSLPPDAESLLDLLFSDGAAILLSFSGRTGGGTGAHSFKLH